MEIRKNTDAPEEEFSVTELDRDKLEGVVGGDDPFAQEPRVPEQPIDPELRKDG